MQYASENIIPVTLELGGKSPNIFFDDVSSARDDFYDKALEGFTMFALNQGEVCTCPTPGPDPARPLRRLPGRRDRPHRADRAGPPAGHRHDGRRAGLERPAGEDPVLPGDRPGRGRQGADRRRAGGPRRRAERRLLRAADHLRGLQQDAHLPGGDLRPGRLGRPRSTTTTTRIKIANDTLYGLGAGVWTPRRGTAYRAGRAIQAGRVWTNCYHLYPAHAAFGGYKGPGSAGRTTR